MYAVEAIEKLGRKHLLDVALARQHGKCLATETDVSQ